MEPLKALFARACRPVAPLPLAVGGIRRWPGWYRHITLALLAYAFLAVTRAQAANPERAKGDTAA